MAEQKHTKAYLWSVIFLGGGMTISAAFRMPWESLGLRFFLLAFITVGISSRFSIRIPRANTNSAMA